MAAHLDIEGPDPPRSRRQSTSSRHGASSDELTGVVKVEAAMAVWGPNTRWILFVGIALSAYIYSLDSMTTYQYLSYATSSVMNHSLSGTITTAQAIIIAVGKPFMAKLADVLGRGEAFLVVAILYVFGYIIIASAHGITQIAVGEIIYAFGYTGLQMLQQIIVADITTLRWRGLVGGLVTAPFIINIFVSAEIASRILPDWRRGYVMFAVLVPIMLAPLIAALLWSQHRAKVGTGRRNLRAMLSSACNDMDFAGLVLVALSLALILLPLGIAPETRSEWAHGSLLGMAAVGLVLFAAFLYYEWKVPTHPVFPMRWLSRTPILSACIIGFLDFASFYLQYTYLYPFILVTQDWSLKNITYYIYTHALAITVFGILAGFIMFVTRRFKWMLFIGLLVRLLGVVIMLHARASDGTTFELVICQVLQGLGGGFASVATQVGAQAAVPHADVATVTAMTLLLSEVGNSVGSAAATGIWNTYMPRDLAQHVPTNNQTLLDDLFGSITDITAYPIDDPIRIGAIEAYRAVMHRLVSVAIIIAVFPPIVCVFMTKDIRLSNTRSAAAAGGLDGLEALGRRTPGNRTPRSVRSFLHGQEEVGTPDEMAHLNPQSRGSEEYV